jgi:two-component system OmpR family response regulator
MMLPDESVPAEDPVLARDVGERLLTEVKSVAQAITDRVLRTLRESPGSIPQLGDPSRPLRALCVDDYPDAADTLAEVIRMLGCEVRVCYDGPTALAVAEEFQPDICFLDLMMPGMDGVQLAKRLREAAQSRPMFIAATTALGSVQEQTTTALAGFHAHLIKPVDTAALRATLDRFREGPSTPPPDSSA